MMIDKRLIGLVESTRRTVAVHVGALWCALVANICLMVCFSESVLNALAYVII